MNTHHTPTSIPATTYLAPPKAPPTTHIYVLLDRSGSMKSIRSDVIGGFNTFLAQQQADGDDARLTLVQFDSRDLAEVVYENRPIAKVKPLTEATFVPRGGTPLLDATGLLIAKAKKRAKARAAKGKPESIVFVTITDGHENASRKFKVAQIREQIEKRTAKGWTFVFLSAGPDAYGEARHLGYNHDAVQAWVANGHGTQAIFGSMSTAMAERRQATRCGAPINNRTFFNGTKPAEEDLDPSSHGATTP